MPRPGKLPEAPEPAKQNGAAGAEATVIASMEVNGEVHNLRSGSWSWRDEHELYVMTGLGWPRILAEIRTENASPFLVGCLVFLARRGAGDAVTFDEVQTGIDAESEIDLNLNPSPLAVAKTPTPRRRKDPAPEDPGSS